MVGKDRRVWSGNRSSKEKRNERESGGVDGARARRNSLGIVNFRCNVISIRVFRMNYWPVPLIPSGGYIWYSLLLSAPSYVRCIPQEAALYPAYFIPSRCSLLLQRAFVRDAQRRKIAKVGIRRVSCHHV